MNKTDRSESLELLLDVLCNTLGGVIFIALLVIIIARAAAPGIGSRTAESRTERIANLTEEKKELEERLAADRNLLAPMAAPAAPAAEKNVRKLEAELAVLRRERLALEARLAAARPLTPLLIQPEFPGKELTAKEPFWLIVTRRHLFRVGRSANFTDAGRSDAAFVDTEERTGGDGVRYWVLTPKRGWRLDSPEAMQSAVQYALTGCDPETQFLSILTAPDAVAELWALRPLFRQAGFRMALQLVPPGDFTLREYTGKNYEATR